MNQHSFLVDFLIGKMLPDVLTSMKCYDKAAIDVIICSDIGVMLSFEYALQKKDNQKYILQIFEYVKFLCRQGIALRGDEKDSNFMELLLLWSFEVP